MVAQHGFRPVTCLWHVAQPRQRCIFVEGSLTCLQRSTADKEELLWMTQMLILLQQSVKHLSELRRHRQTHLPEVSRWSVAQRATTLYWSETAVQCLPVRSLETRAVIFGMVARQWPLMFISIYLTPALSCSHRNNKTAAPLCSKNGNQS